MRNASFHKRDEFDSVFKKRDVFWSFCLLNSPDLNPIQHQWTKLKSIRAKHRFIIVSNFFECGMELLKRMT